MLLSIKGEPVVFRTNRNDRLATIKSVSFVDLYFFLSLFFELILESPLVFD